MAEMSDLAIPEDLREEYDNAKQRGWTRRGELIERISRLTQEYAALKPAPEPVSGDVVEGERNYVGSVREAVSCYSQRRASFIETEEGIEKIVEKAIADRDAKWEKAIVDEFRGWSELSADEFIAAVRSSLAKPAPSLRREIEGF